MRTKMDRKETAGLMKEVPGTFLSQMGWPDGWRGGGTREERRREGGLLNPLIPPYPTFLCMRVESLQSLSDSLQPCGL